MSDPLSAPVQAESSHQETTKSPSHSTNDLLLQKTAELAEALRADRPRANRDRSELPLVEVGRCGIIACAEECLADCQTCCDTKWLMAPYEPGRDTRPGKQYGPRRCPDCEFDEDRDDPNRQRVLTLSAAGFYNGREPIGTFQNYDPNRQTGEGREQCRAALQAVKSWAMREGPHFVVLMGGTGVGKTHLAEAAAEYLAITRRAQVALIPGEDFSYMLGRYLNSEDDQRRAYEGRLRQTDWLVLDEVGIAHGKNGEHNEYVSSLYREIIGWRFAQGLPTLVTGNLAGDVAIKQILGDRVFDRLYDSGSSRVITMWKAVSQRRGRR